MRRAAALLALSLAASGPAQAAPADDAKAQAKAALARANDAYRASRFAAAAEAYLEAHAALSAAGLEASPALLYNAGLAYERLGDCEQVAELFERFLRAAPEKATPDLRRRAGEAEQCAPKVALTSEPPGAEVRLDGAVRGLTPLSFHLRPGSYTLAVSKPGFRDARRAFTHARGAPLALSFALTPAGAFGSLALEVPFPAQISVDGEPLARGPYRGIRRVEAGQHQIRLEQPGCAPRTLTVEVPEGEAPLQVRPEAACLADAAPPTAVSGPAEPPPNPVPAAVWWAGGAGVAAVVAGAVFSGLYVDATHRRDVLLADPAATGADARAADQDAYRWSWASGISYGLGGVGLAAAVVLYLTRDTPGPVTPTADGLAVRF
jgi:hypothetical protein